MSAAASTDNAAGERSAASSSSSSSSKGDQNRESHGTVVRVELPVLAIALLVSCSLSYLGGELFRMQMPNHPVTRYAASLGLHSDDVSPRGATTTTTKAHHAHRSVDAPGETGTARQKGQAKKSLPRPKLERGKVMPETKYTSGSQVADGGVDAVRDSFHLHIEAEVEEEEEEGGETQCAENRSNSNAADDDDDDEEEHLPAGQHLLVDIKNVDGTFLNSEERLASAMVELIYESRLTLLSYHCHSMIPAGVSCVGVLLESHVSFHTWPVEGVITLDLFTCGPNSLLPSVGTVKRLFAVPQPGAGTYRPPPSSEGGGTMGDGPPPSSSLSYAPREEDYVPPPHVLWSHVLRGFRPPLEGGGYRVLENDVTDIVLSRLDLDHKVEVASVRSEYQHISVYDVIEPRFGSTRQYERSVRPELGDTYEGRHPELFRPDRKVFLDGVVQSSRHGDEAYHEALVHPGMFAHPHPERVAVIGGGEGATLREILKHRTVDHVKMIEIDEVMVNVSREFLPDWSDCSDLMTGSASADESSCFDDPRAEILFEDALGWFMDRFDYPPCDCDDDNSSLSGPERAHCKCDGEEEEDDAKDGDDDEEEEEEEEEDSSSDDEEDNINRPPPADVKEDKFDVIIMDALDPQEEVAFAEELYKNTLFLESLYGALTDEGVLVMQLGNAPSSSDPAEERGHNRNRAEVTSIIEGLGFASMHVYEEGHCGFMHPWSFLVACKSYDCRFQWHASEATFATEIYRRIVPTKSDDGAKSGRGHGRGRPALKYFDGATMKSYQVPHKSWERVFCRRQNPTPKECAAYRGLDPKVKNRKVDDFEVRTSSVGEQAGRGTFSKVDLQKGSYLSQENAYKTVHFSHWSTFLIERFLDRMEEAEDLKDLHRYMGGYGVEQDTVAANEYYVDSDLLAFVNHGCNGTSNIGSKHGGGDQSTNEALLDSAKDSKDSILNAGSGSRRIFNPVYDRHLPGVASGYESTLRDIKAGEELLSNYLYYSVSGPGWAKELKSLQEQCKGESVGQITADETEWEESKKEANIEG